MGIIDSHPSYACIITVVVFIPSIVPIKIPPALNSIVTSVPNDLLIFSSGDISLFVVVNRP